MSGFQFVIPDDREECVAEVSLSRISRWSGKPVAEETEVQRELYVCRQMLEMMLDVVSQGLESSDVKSAKKWVKCVLFTITKLVYECADEASREEVIGKIFEKWVASMRALKEQATKYEADARMDAELARCLHANGWEQQALEKDKWVETVCRTSEYMANNAEVWAKLIEQVRTK
jgi:hypothetical protein